MTNVGKDHQKPRGLYMLIRKYFSLYLRDRSLSSSPPVSASGKFCPQAVLDTEDVLIWCLLTLFQELLKAAFQDVASGLQQPTKVQVRRLGCP